MFLMIAGFFLLKSSQFSLVACGLRPCITTGFAVKQTEMQKYFLVEKGYL